MDSLQGARHPHELNSQPSSYANCSLYLDQRALHTNIPGDNADSNLRRQLRRHLHVCKGWLHAFPPADGSSGLHCCTMIVTDSTQTRDNSHLDATVPVRQYVTDCHVVLDQAGDSFWVVAIAGRQHTEGEGSAGLACGAGGRAYRVRAFDACHPSAVAAHI